MSVAPLQQPADGRLFCVYGFPFVLRTNFGESRESFARLYRQFLSPSVRPKSELKQSSWRESDRFRWGLQEKTGASIGSP